MEELPTGKRIFGVPVMPPHFPALPPRPSGDGQENIYMEVIVEEDSDIKSSPPLYDNRREVLVRSSRRSLTDTSSSSSLHPSAAVWPKDATQDQILITKTTSRKTLSHTDLAKMNSDVAGSLHYYPDPEIRVGTTVASGTLPCVTGAMTTVSDPDALQLCHEDFMPHLIKHKKFGGEEYEDFSHVMDAVNTWLQQKPYAQMFSLESVTWWSIDKPVFTDNAVVHRSMSTHRKTKYIRGLRLWYHTADDTFYSGKSNHQAPLLMYRDFTPSSKASTTTQLLYALNQSLRKRSMHGRILRVETLSHPSDKGSGCCAWRERPERDRRHVMFLRVFCRADETASHMDINIKDFLPCYDQKSVHNRGYELSSDMWKRAARWVHVNPSQRLLHVQTVYVKHKEGCGLGDNDIWERCHYMEHACAHGSTSNCTTSYLQMLRLVFARPVSSRVAPGLPMRLTYNNFSPDLVTPRRTSDMEETPGHYEDLRQLETRINGWLSKKDVVLFGVETIPTRMHSGGQEKLATEATFVVNGRESRLEREPWMYNIKIYV